MNRFMKKAFAGMVALATTSALAQDKNVLLSVMKPSDPGITGTINASYNHLTKATFSDKYTFASNKVANFLVVDGVVTRSFARGQMFNEHELNVGAINPDSNVVEKFSDLVGLTVVTCEGATLLGNAPTDVPSYTIPDEKRLSLGSPATWFLGYISGPLDPTNSPWACAKQRVSDFYSRAKNSVEEYGSLIGVGSATSTFSATRKEPKEFVNVTMPDGLVPYVGPLKISGRFDFVYDNEDPKADNAANGAWQIPVKKPLKFTYVDDDGGRHDDTVTGTLRYVESDSVKTVTLPNGTQFKYNATYEFNLKFNEQQNIGNVAEAVKKSFGASRDKRGLAFSNTPGIPTVKGTWYLLNSEEKVATKSATHQEVEAPLKIDTAFDVRGDGVTRLQMIQAYRFLLPLMPALLDP